MEGSEEAAAARWRQCGRLVHAVRAVTQEKKFYDDSVKALRVQLRAEFEALLLDDYSYAQVRLQSHLHWGWMHLPLNIRDAGIAALQFSSALGCPLGMLHSAATSKRCIRIFSGLISNFELLVH